MKRERILAWSVLAAATAAFAAVVPRGGCGGPNELQVLQQREDALCRQISTIEANLPLRQRALSGGPADAEYRELVQVRDRISRLESPDPR